MTRPSRSELYRLYWEEDLSQSEIAAQLGVHRTSVNNWLREYDIQRKGMSRSAKIRIERTGTLMGKPYIPRQEMYTEL